MKTFYLVPKSSVHADGNSQQQQQQQRRGVGERGSPPPPDASTSLPPPPPFPSAKRVSKGRGGGGRVKKKRQKQRKGIISLKTYTPYRGRQSNIANPPLTVLVYNATTSISKRDSLLSLLSYLENKPNIQWNQDGDLIAPFSGINVVTMAKDFLNAKSTPEASKIPFYKMLLSYTNIPPSAITNKKIRSEIFGLTGGLKSDWISYKSRYKR